MITKYGKRNGEMVGCGGLFVPVGTNFDHMRSAIGTIQCLTSQTVANAKLGCFLSISSNLTILSRVASGKYRHDPFLKCWSGDFVFA